MSRANPMYVIVVGGGKVGYHLTKTLITEGHEVLLIEKDRKSAEYLTDQLGEVVMAGDGCEVRIMEEAGMRRANVVVAVTGDDEDNLVICQMAKRQFGVPRTLSRVNDPNNEALFLELGIDQTISSTRVIFNLLEQQIESSQVIPLAALKKGEIEVVEADITVNSPVVGKKIGQLDLPPNTLIISVIRDDHATLPHADTKLRDGDSVIALIKAERERELRSVFTGEQL
ncbi:MAG: TrkA family potassium uptake protein [Armatimonadetes bacterium]|nr:TrkA family potassium uptake protein [Armatimonadota bacterium]